VEIKRIKYTLADLKQLDNSNRFSNYDSKRISYKSPISNPRPSNQLKWFQPINNLKQSNGFHNLSRNRPKVVRVNNKPPSSLLEMKYENREKVFYKY
jgi:hypothetical protein